jgi:pilus assembly protein TadC
MVLGTGLALDQSMMRVSEEMQYIYPELATEFATVVMQVRAGQGRSAAFRQLVTSSGIEADFGPSPIPKGRRLIR